MLISMWSESRLRLKLGLSCCSLMKGASTQKTFRSWGKTISEERRAQAYHVGWVLVCIKIVWRSWSTRALYPSTIRYPEV
ncbi:hypothetical protein BDB00DRAFT_348531 [Zychaea mexicana]|uniref:uncharacterized protein n=1 Tax=Zychaea mexicana TaxID=64656 RepID=UPI0022FDB24E|nr:uncharacterized protein BDB00DRAFT_348531 [Zychaea mexicana]KAI9493863.1 hypothetical protein BDB00DRAFT_348531 [Zychaea mexicana]